MPMAKWRAIALKELPELQQNIGASQTIMQFWIELRPAFENAYNRKDESLIQRIYAFANWCVGASRNSDPEHDPSTAVIVCFYEHIPTFPAARDDTPRWFRYSDVAEDERTFSYFIGKEQYRKLLQYMAKNQHRYQNRSGHPG